MYVSVQMSVAVGMLVFVRVRERESLLRTTLHSRILVHQILTTHRLLHASASEMRSNEMRLNEYYMGTPKRHFRRIRLV